LKYLTLLLLVVPASGIVLSHAGLRRDCIADSVLALVGSLLVARCRLAGWAIPMALRRQAETV